LQVGIAPNDPAANFVPGANRFILGLVITKTGYQFTKGVKMPVASSTTQRAQAISAMTDSATVIAVMVALTFPTFSVAQNLTTGPVEVTSGETMVVGDRAVRICGINSLEKPDAQDVLASIVAGKTVECKLIGDGTPCDGRLPREFYNTFNAQCFADGEDIATLLIAAGSAEEVPLYSGGAYSN
jgi:endonuclease YncB( thermonuclease family)